KICNNKLSRIHTIKTTSTSTNTINDRRRPSCRAIVKPTSAHIRSPSEFTIVSPVYPTAAVSVRYLSITKRVFSKSSHAPSSSSARQICQLEFIRLNNSAISQKNKNPCNTWVKLYGSSNCCDVFELHVSLVQIAKC